MKKMLILGFALILVWVMVGGVSAENIKDEIISVGGRPEINVTDYIKQKINIILNDFNLTITWVDLGNFPFSDENVPFHFVSSNRNYLTYMEKTYQGYISGSGYYGGKDDGYWNKNNKGLEIWDFYFHINFIPTEYYSKDEPTDSIIGDFYLSMRINKTNDIPITIRAQGDSFISGHFVITKEEERFIFHSQKISSLEQNQTLIQQTIQTITSTISNILDSLNDLILKVDKVENENKAQQTKIDNHESRIKSLENSSSEGDSEFKSYLKYLSDSDKKKILCGYAEEKHLTHIEDLGLSCDLTYKTSKSGKENVRCKC